MSPCGTSASLLSPEDDFCLAHTPCHTKRTHNGVTRRSHDTSEAAAGTAGARRENRRNVGRRQGAQGANSRWRRRATDDNNAGSSLSISVDISINTWTVRRRLSMTIHLWTSDWCKYLRLARTTGGVHVDFYVGFPIFPLSSASSCLRRRTLPAPTHYHCAVAVPPAPSVCADAPSLRRRTVCADASAPSPSHCAVALLSAPSHPACAVAILSTLTHYHCAVAFPSRLVTPPPTSL